MDKYQWGWSWFSDSAMKAKRGKPWEDDYRIPNDTYAHHYDLYLHPDLEAGTFSGKVTVHITASNQVKQLCRAGEELSSQFTVPPVPPSFWNLN